MNCDVDSLALLNLIGESGVSPVSIGLCWANMSHIINMPYSTSHQIWRPKQWSNLPSEVSLCHGGTPQGKLKGSAAGGCLLTTFPAAGTGPSLWGIPEALSQIYYTNLRLTLDTGLKSLHLYHCFTGFFLAFPIEN